MLSSPFLPDPKEYTEAFNFARNHIKKLMFATPCSGWLRCDEQMFSFDDMNFYCNNTIFSVLLKIYKNGKELFVDRDRQKRFLIAAKHNNLVPCYFPVNITGSGKKQTISCKKGGFNLIDPQTGREINPIKKVAYKKIPMSHYELQLMALEVVYSELREKGYNIEIFCDDSEMHECFPHIWFRDNKGNLCWCIIKYHTNNTVKIPDMSVVPKKVFPYEYDGFFVSVTFEYEKERAYRGDKVAIYIDKDPLVQIHKAEPKH